MENKNLIYSEYYKPKKRGRPKGSYKSGNKKPYGFRLSNEEHYLITHMLKRMRDKKEDDFTELYPYPKNLKFLSSLDYAYYRQKSGDKLYYISSEEYIYRVRSAQILKNLENSFKILYEGQTYDISKNTYQSRKLKNIRFYTCFYEAYTASLIKNSSHILKMLKRINEAKLYYNFCELLDEYSTSLEPLTKYARALEYVARVLSLDECLDISHLPLSAQPFSNNAIENLMNTIIKFKGLRKTQPA